MVKFNLLRWIQSRPSARNFLSDGNPSLPSLPNKPNHSTIERKSAITSFIHLKISLFTTFTSTLTVKLHGHTKKTSDETKNSTSRQLFKTRISVKLFELCFRQNFLQRLLTGKTSIKTLRTFLVPPWCSKPKGGDFCMPVEENLPQQRWVKGVSFADAQDSLR